MISVINFAAMRETNKYKTIVILPILIGAFVLMSSTEVKLQQKGEWVHRYQPIQLKTH